MKKIVVIEWFIEPEDVPSNQRIFEYIQEEQRGSCPQEENVHVSLPKSRTALVYRIDEQLKEKFRKNRSHLDFCIIALLADGRYVEEAFLSELKKQKSSESQRLLRQAEDQLLARELRQRLKSGL